MRTLVTSFALLLVCIPAAHGQDKEANVLRKADSLLLNTQYQEAIGLIDAAPNSATSFLLQNKKADALVRAGNLPEAEKLLNQINLRLASEPDDFIKAIVDTNLGSLQMNQGRSDLAEVSLLSALSGFLKSGKSNTQEAAQAHSTLGIVYMTLGKYSQAQEQLHRALSLREAGMINADEWIAASYNDLGLVYSPTDKDKALGYFEKAHEMYLVSYGAMHPKVAIAHINLGILYRDLEFLGDATNHFETALKIWNAVYIKPNPAKALALYNLGQTYLQLKDNETAMKYYRLALSMYADCYGPRHPEVASVLNAIGNLQLADADFAGALASYQQALQANAGDFHSDDIKRNPSLKNYYNGTRLLHTLLFKAQALEARYLRKSLKFSDLQDALQILTKCDSLIDQLRQHSSHESDKLLLGAMANEVYADGVRIAYEAGVNALRKAQYFEQAFYFAEKSKSAVLLESITETNARSFAGIPDNLLEEEKNLKSALVLTSRKLAEKPPEDEEKILRDQSFAIAGRYENFIHSLERDFPEYYNLKFNSSTPTIEQLQNLLHHETALLSYFIDEKNNALYIFLIRKNKFKVVHRPLDINFDKYITGLRNGIYFNEINTLKKSAFALSRMLVPHISSLVSELVILPTGRLGLIPFETLLLRDPGDVQDYRSMPWLVRKFGVRYEFSAGLMLQKSGRPVQNNTPSIFLCAPVSFPGREYLGELPGTENEILGISRLFSEKHLTTAAYTRIQADESLIKTTKLKDYDFVHFATHGVVDETNPELSRIFLQSGTGSEDGSLFTGEIYNLQLDADLVTLSACQTGLGKVMKGEGVIGLSRALVYAGARNIVVSFWNVADESTAILMRDFYQNILEHPGDNYSTDLRRAKLLMQENQKYGAPFYWAPFVLIGF